VLGVAFFDNGRFSKVPRAGGYLLLPCLSKNSGLIVGSEDQGGPDHPNG